MTEQPDRNSPHTSNLAPDAASTECRQRVSRAGGSAAEDGGPPKNTLPLLVRCIDGRDEAAWEQLISQFGPRIRGGVRRALYRARVPACTDRVQEIEQEVYCRLLQRGGRTLRECRSGNVQGAGSYLARVAQRTARDVVRRQCAQRRGGRSALRVGCSALPPDVLSDQRPNPEQSALDDERLRSLLVRCWSVLAGDEQAQRNFLLLILAWIAGWSSSEIARSLDGQLKPTSVNSLLTRLRFRLRADAEARPWS